VAADDVAAIVAAVASVGFKEELAAPGGPGRPPLGAEAAVVQDADRRVRFHAAAAA